MEDSKGMLLFGFPTMRVPSGEQTALPEVRTPNVVRADGCRELGATMRLWFDGIHPQRGEGREGGLPQGSAYLSDPITRDRHQTTHLFSCGRDGPSENDCFVRGDSGFGATTQGDERVISCPDGPRIDRAGGGATRHSGWEHMDSILSSPRSTH